MPGELHSAGTCEQFYDSKLDGIEMAPVFVAFVDAEAVVTLNHEHSKYKWVSMNSVEEHLVTPNQREMFAYVRRHFVERQPTEWTQIDFRSQRAT